MDFELVSVTTSDGVRLDGTLARPAGDPALGVDLVILHHGFSANFYGPGFFGPMQEALASAGVAALRVNNRGHDLVYNSSIGRLGASYEMMADCRLDWQAWLDFASSQGYRCMVPWGHSLGAVKNAYVAAEGVDARVPGVILSSPPRFSYSQVTKMERGEAWMSSAAEARRLVDAGQSKELMQITEPLNTLMTAATFADKYGPDETYNVLNLLPKIPAPVLITLGGEEGTGPKKADWTAFGHLDEQLRALAREHKQLTYESIDGANHVYSGKSAEVWKVASSWLQHLEVAAPAG
jgi:pimeloyl-ACP methyl ester carboxylesterase